MESTSSLKSSKSSKFEIPVLVLAMVFPSLLTWVYFVHLAGTPAGMQQIAYGIGKTIQFALPVFWVGAVCRERWRVRFPSFIKSEPRPSGNGGAKKLIEFFRIRIPLDLVEGFAFGSVVYIAMDFLYLLWLGEPGGPLGDGSFARTTIYNRIAGFELEDPRIYILLGLFYLLIHSGLEEYYWRWFVFGRLSRIMPWTAALVVSGLGFMAHHIIILGAYFGYGSIYCWLGAAGVAVGGFYWAWLYRRSDSIWGPWISHGIVDAAIFSIGYMIVTGH